MHEPRLTAIEEKVAFIEHQFDELNEAVRELGEAMSALSRRLDRLADARDSAKHLSGGDEPAD